MGLNELSISSPKLFKILKSLQKIFTDLTIKISQTKEVIAEKEKEISSQENVIEKNNKKYLESQEDIEKKNV